METTDGAPGTMKAITTTWPTTRIQRCLVRIRRDTVCDLPLRPRTTQGRALLGLSRKLMTATTDQAATWVTALNSYATEYRTWLNQRTTAQDDPHANASPQPLPSPTPPTPLTGAPPPHHKKDHGHAKAGPGTPTNATTRHLKHHVHANTPLRNRNPPLQLLVGVAGPPVAVALGFEP